MIRLHCMLSLQLWHHFYSLYKFCSFLNFHILLISYMCSTTHKLGLTSPCIKKFLRKTVCIIIMVPFSLALQGRFCLHLADLHKTYITCQLLKIFWWILLVYIQTFSNVLLLKYIDPNQTLDIQDFIQNGIVVNNYTQEQNFTLFYQSKGLDTMRIWLPYIKSFWVVLINTLICFNNVNCLLNDNDKKSSDLCTVRPRGYQPPFHSLSGQCLLIWWWQYLMYIISGLNFFCRLKINLYTKSIFFSSLFL